MKKLVMMLAFGLAIAGTSQAQNGSQGGRDNDRKVEQVKNEKRAKLSPEQRAIQRTEKLTQKLDLNKSQQKKLQALNLKHAKQIESIAHTRERNEKQSQQMQKLQASWEKEFKSIVNKKQFANYQEERKQMQANRGKNNGQFRREHNGKSA
ncbi:hypothetical protein ACFSKU_08005 [Pontibacter silvestris]|uniref:DUF4890 domain-containing protein n=1 Tax=Pontibacter silvestris TaxID=2305183 RepID=A0ABW4WWN5_9BACT|nr:hypothetical protein [Pontibacter silvestris]MCC9138984.1 hypothetical protein [Pontibacter silvestris]